MSDSSLITRQRDRRPPRGIVGRRDHCPGAQIGSDLLRWLDDERRRLVVKLREVVAQASVRRVADRPEVIRLFTARLAGPRQRSDAELRGHARAEEPDAE